MKNATKTCPELETECRENGPDVIERLDELRRQATDLGDRLYQIKSLSTMAQDRLGDTVSCSGSDLDVLFGVIRAIECIASHPHISYQ